LNISGEKSLLKTVKEVYASLFEPRAIYYRAINNYDHVKVGIAIPIQRMVQSKKSGILFTTDPLTNNHDVLIIDAILGLGEAIDSGAVIPDHFVIDKESLKILDKQIAQQAWQIIYKKNKNTHTSLTKEQKTSQKITDEELLEIARLGKQIEQHYKFPQDSEWAIEDGQIYFVHVRPMTALPPKTKKIIPIELHDDKFEATIEPGALGAKILKGVPASVGIATGPVVIVSKLSDIEGFKEGSILVAETTSPSYAPAMKKAVAIITDSGGMTSHAAIISREIGIPAVVGTGSATNQLKEGQVITVDAVKGIVYKGKLDKKEVISSHKQDSQQEEKRPSGFVEEIPITGTKLYINLADPSKAKEFSRLPIDGVGLLRAEFMIANLHEHPMAMLKSGRGEEFIGQLTDGILEIANAFKPRPVIYRATDLKTNEYRELPDGKNYEPTEENPMLGFRGAARYIKQPEIFAMEIQALKNVRDKYNARNVHLMIPFIRTVDELIEIKKILAQAGLKNDGQDFKLWIMAEVPSTVFLIDKFCQAGIDGVSIGSNDLTQLILGVDRDNGTLNQSFDERNEAVIMAMRHIIDVTKSYGVSSSICGNAVSNYPEITEALVRSGITSISVTPDVAVSTKQLIASVERRILLDR
jgi:pyruvate,water dikinase